MRQVLILHLYTPVEQIYSKYRFIDLGHISDSAELSCIAKGKVAQQPRQTNTNQIFDKLHVVESVEDVPGEFPELIMWFFL